MNSFTKRVYTQTQQIPKGSVSTYKELAQALGTRAYRAVGRALANNPDTTTTPCHRVIRSDLRVGGYMGEVSTATTKKKIALLKQEGVRINKEGIVDTSCLHRFTQPKECFVQDHYTE